LAHYTFVLNFHLVTIQGGAIIFNLVIQGGAVKVHLVMLVGTLHFCCYNTGWHTFVFVIQSGAVNFHRVQNCAFNSHIVIIHSGGLNFHLIIQGGALLSYTYGAVNFNHVQIGGLTFILLLYRVAHLTFIFLYRVARLTIIQGGALLSYYTDWRT
jgi:hypothetical protein